MTSSSATRTRGNLFLALAVAAWALLGVGGTALAGTGPQLDERRRIAQVIESQVRRHRLARALAWAVIDQGRVERGWVAVPQLALRIDPALARFEIGSITKTFTAWLAAEEVAAGRLRWSTTLGEILPDAGLDPSLAAISLEALARHRSGLPRLSIRLPDIVRGTVSSPHDPYAGSTESEIWAALAAVGPLPPDAHHNPGYSNLGYAVLGHALARAAATDFETLLRRRVLEAHGLAAMHLSRSGKTEPRLIPGTGSHGLSVPPWHLDAYGPAGGIIASLDDLVRYAELLLDPPPTLAMLLAPPADFSDQGTSVSGLGFAHRRLGNDHVRWHNGGTAGFRSFLAVVPERKFAVVLLASTSVSLDALGWHLIDPSQPPPVNQPSWFALVVMMLGLIVAPLALAFGAWRGAAAIGPAGMDRLAVLERLFPMLFLVAMARPLGDWMLLAIECWWAALGLSLVCAAVLLWRELPARPWNAKTSARAVRAVLWWCALGTVPWLLYQR